MRSEPIKRGTLTVGGSPAALSHVRITVGGGEPYDEVAYRTAGDGWVVVASHLDQASAAALFAALDGQVAKSVGDLTAAVAEVLDGPG